MFTLSTSHHARSCLCVQGPYTSNTGVCLLSRTLPPSYHRHRIPGQCFCSVNRSVAVTRFSSFQPQDGMQSVWCFSGGEIPGWLPQTKPLSACQEAW